MTLFELFQKEFEENLANEEKAKLFKQATADLELKSKKTCAAVGKAFNAGKLTWEDAAKRLVQIKNLTDNEMDRLGKEFKMTSDYIKMLVHIKDAGYTISNQTLCTLLKNLTHENWSESIVMSTENGKSILRLVFQNENYEKRQKVVAQMAIVNDRKECDEAIEKMNNINWFEEYLSAERQAGENNERVHMLMTGKRCPMPKLIQNALEEAFKKHDVPCEMQKTKI